MEFLSTFLVLLVIAVPLMILVTLVRWVFFSKPDETITRLRDKSPNQTNYQDPEDYDPNWEDHIRHDPYHPGGSGGGAGRW